MGRVVGIDLGTTNSLVAYHDGREPRIIPLPSGDRLLPSVVAVDPTYGLVLGKPARDGAMLRPESTIASVKRHMGTDRTFVLGGDVYRPEDVSALILRELRRAAESALLAPVDRAVISVPAYFSDPQRRATREAGELAGLRVERLVNEPTAAALAFGLSNLDIEDYVLVYDLGGGTFDVTVLEMFEGVLNVRASGGDTHLGGDDFDALLLQTVLAESHLGAGAGELTPEAMARLRLEVERAKIALSGSVEATIEVDDLPTTNHRLARVSAKVTRDALERLTRSLLEKTGRIVMRTLSEARVSKEKVGEVILVGGPTRMPMVREFVASLLGRAPREAVDPMEAVALGAAIQASLLDPSRSDEIVITDVSPFTLGVSVVGEIGGQLRPGVFNPLITRNASLPAKRSEVFSTCRPDQDTVVIEVYQGEDPLVENDIFLDRYFLGGFPTGTGQPEALQITFRYDVDGILHVDSTVLATGKSAGIRIDPAKMRSVGQATHLAKSRIEALWAASEHRRALEELLAALVPRLGEFPPEWRSRVEGGMAEARAALTGDDPRLLERVASSLRAWQRRLETRATEG